MKGSELKVDKTWTLFLDRDGVINLHYPNDYVKNWNEFYFLEGVMEALKDLSHCFGRIIIVTNQQGVGKGIMSDEDLKFIHAEMLKEIRKYGGRVHMIYAATEKVENDFWKLRKPNIGMAKQARKDFPAKLAPGPAGCSLPNDTRSGRAVDRLRRRWGKS